MSMPTSPMRGELPYAATTATKDHSATMNGAMVAEYTSILAAGYRG
jgi:hypothetical protein